MNHRTQQTQTRRTHRTEEDHREQRLQKKRQRSQRTETDYRTEKTRDGEQRQIAENLNRERVSQLLSLPNSIKKNVITSFSF